MLPGIRRELPVEGSAGKMSENTRNIQNDGKSTKNPSIDKRITKKKKSRLTINFKIVYKIDNMNDVGVKTINKFNPIPYSTLKNSYFVVYRRGLGNI